MRVGSEFQLPVPVCWHLLQQFLLSHANTEILVLAFVIPIIITGGFSHTISLSVMSAEATSASLCIEKA